MYICKKRSQGSLVSEDATIFFRCSHLQFCFQASTFNAPAPKPTANKQDDKATNSADLGQGRKQRLRAYTRFRKGPARTNCIFRSPLQRQRHGAELTKRRRAKVRHKGTCVLLHMHLQDPTSDRFPHVPRQSSDAREELKEIKEETERLYCQETEGTGNETAALAIMRMVF